MKLRFAGQDMMLHPAGAVYWPAPSILMVADLHLEKGSHFARRGFYLPPYDSRETLQKLLDVVAAFNPDRLVVLGDSFHDPQGYDRLGDTEKILFERLTAFDPVWVRGNHDGPFVPPGFAAADVFHQDGVALRHEARADDAGPEISGHFHPKTDMIHKGGRIARPCFIEDGVRLILPAFGAYTGGLAVTHASIAGLFPNGYRLHVLGDKRIYSLA